jgi:hypothetical protein
MSVQKVVIVPSNHNGFIAFKAVSSFQYNKEENLISQGDIENQMIVSDTINKDTLGTGGFNCFKLLIGQQFLFWYETEIGKKVQIIGVIVYCDPISSNDELTVKVEVIATSVS